MTMNYETKYDEIIIGYNLESWNYYNIKKEISIEINESVNSHIVICGQSGSGKTYCQSQIFARLIKVDVQSEFYFADYKMDETYREFRGLSNYYSFKETLKALEIVYERMSKRLSGEDTTTNQVTLIWDEYIANMLALITEDKKRANVVMNMVSEILLMGRSKNIRLIISVQRPDATLFSSGARLNFGIVIILGGYVNSIYEMLMPDFKQEIKSKQFSIGEGTIMKQNSSIEFIKIPLIEDETKMIKMCKKALDKGL